MSAALVIETVLMTGCNRQSAEKAAPLPPTVSVSYPVEQEVTDYTDLTGRTAAVDSVEVRARVWGYLDKVNFKEGTLVKKGDVLFEIDPRTYVQILAQAKGNLTSAEAKAVRTEADLKRAQKLMAAQAISREDFDKAIADRGEIVASQSALKATVEQATLDLKFTKVSAEISGRVGRALVTKGNLIQSGQAGGTLLTTIVSVDPMYAYFDVDERTVLRVRQMIRAGKVKSARDIDWPVYLGLANEEAFPHTGTIDFVDNQVNPKTGTLRVRGVFPNKEETLSPGFFARIRLPLGFAHQALLISDRAVDVDQGQKIVYVVGQDNKVALRPIRLGSLHDGRRVVGEGLKQGDRVIVTGLQQVRAGIIVEPTVVEMPKSLGSDQK
jgi:RND family efflux transporter MFP subunit